MKFPSIEEQLAVIKQGAVEVIPETELVTKLKRAQATGKPLRVKQGFDPTAPDIHLGHTVGLRKLRQFQELGHRIVLIIGDYTGMVGDPSGRSATRPQLSFGAVRRNAGTYLKQFAKVLDREKVEIHYNGEWFSKMSFQEIMALAGKFTLARMLERDDFSIRYKEQSPIAIHELFYPLMQAYDSVAIRADVEIGATEQKFNLLAGRQIQEEYGQEPQIVLTLPVLVGTDGVQRMSKTTGNYIGVAEPPDQVYGKAMSIPDEQILPYLELVTDCSPTELTQAREELRKRSVNPMLWKKKLAHRLVTLYHGKGAADRAQAEFEQVFSEKKLPEQIPGVALSYRNGKIPIVQLLMETKQADSKSAARRLIQQGGVSVNQKRVADLDFEVELLGEVIVKVGKRKFIRVLPKRR